MEGVELLATPTDPMLSCSICARLLQEAVQLKCLHNCCRQCFSTAASTVGSYGVSCVACGTITQAGSEQPNGFIDRQVQRYRAIATFRVCSVCKDKGDHDKPALVWCSACRQSLCGDCITVHRQYLRQHLTQFLEGLESLDEVYGHPSASACAIHKKPLDVACRNCERAVCISCWAECNERKHEMHVFGHESCDRYLKKFISSIGSIEGELLQKSEVLKQPKSVLRDMTAARDRHLEEISMRKKRVVDAVEVVYQEIANATKNAYDELESEVESAAAVADRIESDLSNARNYIRRLVESNEKCEILNQQKIVQERLNVLSTQLDSLRDRCTTVNREVKIEASLPDDVENVVQAWIGLPRVYSALTSPTLSRQQQQQSFSFGTASASFNLPVNCVDVALTQDGRSLLLAAWLHGLIELSSACGRELSSWRPPKHSSSDRDDSIMAVAALCDGRAAVSVRYTQLVVLLRRSEKISSGAGGAANGNDAWTEDRRFQLPWTPCCLSTYGDVLAACEWRSRGGKRLQLLSLSSGQRLSGTQLQRDYEIGSLAVAARVVVTGSRDKVKLGGGRRAVHVMDAHSLDADGGGDMRLWRHVLNSSSSSDNNQQGKEEEELRGVCADSSRGCLYAAVCRSDKSSGRVSALSLADGSELRRFALSFLPAAAAAASYPLLLMLPRRLSLCEDGAAEQQGSSSSSRRNDRRRLLVAVLCWDSATNEWKTVMLHRSPQNMLQ